jgi:hypothetical protein
MQARDVEKQATSPGHAEKTKQLAGLCSGWFDPLRHGVAVTKEHAPALVLESISLAGSKCPLLNLPVDRSSHVLKIEGESEVAGDAGQYLRAPIAEVQV